MLDPLFLTCYTLFTDVAISNKRDEKIKLLKAKLDTDENFRKLFILMNDELKTTGISGKTVTKLKESKYDSDENVTYDLMTLYTNLVSRLWTGNTAKSYIQKYMAKMNESEKDMLLKIVSQSLKLGVTNTILSKQFPQWFSAFTLALAEDYEESVFQKNLKTYNYYISTKYDGLRTVIKVYDTDTATNTSNATNDTSNTSNTTNDTSNIVCISRNGNDKTSALSELIKEIKLQPKFKGYVIDCELVWLDPKLSRMDNFKYMNGLMNRKNFEITGQYKIYVFDLIPIEVFDNPNSKLNTKFTERISKFKDFKKSKHIEFIEFTKYTKDKFDKAVERAELEDLEGIVLRK